MTSFQALLCAAVVVLSLGVVVCRPEVQRYADKGIPLSNLQSNATNCTGPSANTIGPQTTNGTAVGFNCLDFQIGALSPWSPGATDTPIVVTQPAVNISGLGIYAGGINCMITLGLYDGSGNFLNSVGPVSAGYLTSWSFNLTSMRTLGMGKYYVRAAFVSSGCDGGFSNTMQYARSLIDMEPLLPIPQFLNTSASFASYTLPVFLQLSGGSGLPDGSTCSASGSCMSGCCCQLSQQTDICGSSNACVNGFHGQCI